MALGFGMAALVGIPMGFMIGRFTVLNRMVSPLISLLRPVSPLAWLPIGLLVFKSANPAAIWTIFICSIWPMIINTAVGVQRVPADYLNVARVLNLSEWKVITKILFPAVLPYMLTGVRLSVGTAWLVIVAAEMLTGGVGIGFWVWDEWNNLNVTHILIAILGDRHGRPAARMGAGQHRQALHLRRRLNRKDHAMNNFIEVQHAEMLFDTKKGRFHALRDINLTVAKGEFITLIGHSGCGKSTLMNLIAGLTLPSSGTLLCDKPRDRRARPGNVPWCSRTTRCCRGSRVSRTCTSPSSVCSARRTTRRARPSAPAPRSNWSAWGTPSPSGRTRSPAA